MPFIRQFGNREVPAAADCQHANGEAEEGSGGGDRTWREAGLAADDHRARADQGSDGVDLGTENGWDFGHQYIADHTATDAGYRAEQGGGDRTELVGERFGCPGDGEQPQTGCIVN